MVQRKLSSDITASKHLGEMILSEIDVCSMGVDYVVSVPLHIMRYAKRGYNQAEVIAKVIGKKLNVPVVNLLKRKQKTVFQSSLSMQDRKKNVKDVFVINGRVLEEYYFNFDDKNILIVDDLCTTGTTLRMAAKVLVHLKPKKLIAVVAAR